jgi:hypothetical protein
MICHCSSTSTSESKPVLGHSGYTKSLPTQFSFILKPCCHLQKESAKIKAILDPLLNAIFVYLPSDLTNLTNFTDDNFILGWNKLLKVLIDDMEKNLKMIMKWLRNSGLQFNEENACFSKMINL